MYTHLTGGCGETFSSAAKAFVHLLVCPRANAPVGKAQTHYAKDADARKARMKSRTVDL